MGRTCVEVVEVADTLPGIWITAFLATLFAPCSLTMIEEPAGLTAFMGMLLGGGSLFAGGRLFDCLCL